MADTSTPEERLATAAGGTFVDDLKAVIEGVAADEEGTLGGIIADHEARIAALETP